MKNFKLNKAFNLWFTGLSGSGKTTTADEVIKLLSENSIKSVQLDGDVIRKGLSNDLGFSEEDREENNRRIIYVSELLINNGIPTLTTFISPFKETRDFARETIDNFIEVYMDTPLEECIKRDVKGLYERAKQGEIKNMTGIDSPYEKPIDAEIVLDTVETGLKENALKVIKYLENNDFLISQ